MKTILVPVDGSEPSLRAVRLAAGLAKPDGRLLLLHVIQPVAAVGYAHARVLEELERAQREEADDLLEAAAGVARELGVAVETRVHAGVPPESIADIASQQDAWMVVIGSRGRGPLTRILLGSTADRVVRLSNKPVLVVR